MRRCFSTSTTWTRAARRNLPISLSRSWPPVTRRLLPTRRTPRGRRTPTHMRPPYRRWRSPERKKPLSRAVFFWRFSPLAGMMVSAGRAGQPAAHLEEVFLKCLRITIYIQFSATIPKTRWTAPSGARLRWGWTRSASPSTSTTA